MYCDLSVCLIININIFLFYTSFFPLFRLARECISASSSEEEGAYIIINIYKIKKKLNTEMEWKGMGGVCIIVGIFVEV